MFDLPDDARNALTEAKGRHALALIRAQQAPNDQEAQTQLRAAVRDGRRVWKTYRDAATADMAAQIDAIVPDAFKGESGDVPQE